MKKTKKRILDYVVISDVHLGTYGCRAQELLNYLKTIQPKVLILNANIIDIWQFNKRLFPKSHMSVINTSLHYCLKVHKSITLLEIMMKCCENLKAFN
jgi:UDP-2,3-diacylglucosamine pyrophosphatase LpxH